MLICSGRRSCFWVLCLATRLGGGRLYLGTLIEEVGAGTCRNTKAYLQIRVHLQLFTRCAKQFDACFCFNH